MYRRYSVKIVVYKFGIGKNRVRKRRACKGRKLNIRADHIAVGKNRKIENGHMDFTAFRLYIHKTAMLKITAVKPFAGKIAVFKMNTRKR